MSKKPRYSLTVIIEKVQDLTTTACITRYPQGLKLHNDLRRISTAAVNEIVRLEAESELVAERAMPVINKRFNDVDKEQ